jgi:hypothetical protein
LDAIAFSPYRKKISAYGKQRLLALQLTARMSKQQNETRRAP